MWNMESKSTKKYRFGHTVFRVVSPVPLDEDPQLAMRFQVSSIPLLVVMKDGEIVGKSLGAKPKHAILSMLP